jgi:hypothetical protein
METPREAMLREYVSLDETLQIKLEDPDWRCSCSANCPANALLDLYSVEQLRKEIKILERKMRNAR